MSERIFILLAGLCILASLYIDNSIFTYAIPAYLLFEGVTNIRLTRLLQAARGLRLDDGLYTYRDKKRFNIEALRIWRIVVAIVLTSSYMLVNVYQYDLLWFFPWFLGFALTGAGVSGICPVLLIIRRIGFN